MIADLWPYTIVMTLVLAAMLVIIKHLRGNNEQCHEEAEAIILALNYTGRMVSNQKVVKLLMQVQPDKGRNFVTECYEMMPEEIMEQLKSGKRLRIKYNPHNLKEVRIIKAA